MHADAYCFVAVTTGYYGPFARVVELGSYDVNGSVRDCFPGALYTGVDLRPGRGVDVVADAAEYQPEAAPDCVVCCEVLEHAPNAAGIVANAAAMLAPGGLLILTCATDPRRPHGVNGGAVGSEHYANIGPGELVGWLAAAGLIASLSQGTPGDLYATGRKPN